MIINLKGKSGIHKPLVLIFLITVRFNVLDLLISSADMKIPSVKSVRSFFEVGRILKSILFSFSYY